MAAWNATSVPGASVIGRYFTVVSLVPSSVFVAYVVLLVRSGAWNGEDVAFAHAIGGLGLKDLALFSAASLLLALALHPLQFALIQAFEGFWGTSRLATRLALANIRRHRRRATSLHRAAVEERMAAHPRSPNQRTPEPPYARRQRATKAQVAALLRSSEAWRLYGTYPHQLESVMPTRLGNVLRRYEILAGATYGLDSMASVPRLLQVADGRDVAYVQNQRMQMELALRTCVLALVASAVTLTFMWGHGPWLFLGLAPYAVAYLTYRGAVVVAHEYGTSLAVLIDLNRFALYDRMHLPMPDNLKEERGNNMLLMDVLRLDNVEIDKRMAKARLDYVHPATSPRTTDATPPQSGSAAQDASFDSMPAREPDPADRGDASTPNTGIEA